MDYSKISNIELIVLADQHELTLPQFFIIKNLVVVKVSFSNLVESIISIVMNRSPLQFLCINTCEG